MALVLGSVCVFSGLAGQAAPPSQPDPAQLALILRSAREYCGKLERAALDFICVEEVEEKLDLRRDDRKALERAAAIRDALRPGDIRGLLSRMEIRRNPKFDNIYLYDYQFVRREGQIEEKRELLEKNGKRVAPGTPRQQLGAFNFADILLAPIQLLDARFEEYYSYRLLAKETYGDAEAWVLEVLPKLAGARYLGGKLWLRTDDASVLRIEWDPATFGHYERIQARAEAYKSAPEVRSYSEFGVEKNGLRFPSADFTEEAYRGANGNLFVRARTSVTYRDHKFFTVETSSTLKK
ncbi:MAG: hypothetical protein A2W03_03820 [Candidatus Aminicenantes bacterium RBG_16_63_16]|nr:MAG: hypothetical protein A2W03_03820 [Candidatus Aminicenantes bacterium RBG_16_63_16]